MIAMHLLGRAVNCSFKLLPLQFGKCIRTANEADGATLFLVIEWDAATADLVLVPVQAMNNYKSYPLNAYPNCYVFPCAETIIFTLYFYYLCIGDIHILINQNYLS